jgi:protein SCO1/2
MRISSPFGTISSSIILLLLLSVACTPDKKLPIAGEKTVVQRMVDGKPVYDTLDHQVPDFKFYNQEGTEVTEALVAGKVYVADFFFTSCPTICPRVKANMKKIYDKYKHKKDFLMLSHSIDTKHDTIARLAWYAQKMNVGTPCWHFLTGKYKDMTKMALGYLLSAMEDKDAPGGFDHSGAIALIDRNRHIRGFYDGNDPEKVEELIKDIAILLREKE